MLAHMVQSQTGIFSHNQDIGAPTLAGASHYDPATQTYTLRGSGYNIWFERDEFHYLYNQVAGDFILTAQVAWVGQGKDPHRKAGLMLRESIDAQAAHVSAALHGDGLTVLQWRALRGACMRDPEDETPAPKRAYTILQLERTGGQITMRAAHPGEPLQVIGTHSPVAPLPDTVLVGLFVCAHDPAVTETVKVWNVRLDRPAPPGYDPARSGYLGCRLETMDVFTGQRQVIYEQPDRFEAPNWMPDGQRLLFNMAGRLYTLPVTGGTPTLLETGFADRNNNDHGISFDGKCLAISHHRAGLPEGGSTIYVLPIEGGTPRLVTTQTPSYWHGWSPDNQAVVFVAKRPGSDSYHIYRADVATGSETRLTAYEGSHVDGPEYSPDGRYIYYNGNASGTMHIWRMKPDGSEPEELTFDACNDWFPHISPDGQWIVFLSFPETIPVDAHPSYQRVMLRMMPAAGGAPRVIGYLYGGQGTINVPSWSPDSRRIAFVSNSGL
ncbi:MAG: SMP-30/gluconolactonase/LRE family protein [Bacteroidia bacterium]